MGRTENIQIFEDTRYLYNTYPTLKEAVERSLEKQLFVPESARVASHSGERRFEKEVTVVVSRRRSFEAAQRYAGKNVCVLNFASASNPGGGVERGASAQEECLCRCSTLYASLSCQKMWDDFYRPHRRDRDPLHNDDCIYTPGVMVFKSDTSEPRKLPERMWYSVNVLTCAAPNLRAEPGNRMNPGDGRRMASISNDELQRLHEKRMRRIMDVAVEQGTQVLILGAFGCGAFQNPPEVVAQAMKTVLEEYNHCFETVEFAVYCSPRDDLNYQVFQEAFK